jgi:hypothetical protein
MIFVTLDTATATENYKTIQTTIMFIIVSTYTMGMAMKIMYYCFFHPWAELIRPRKLGEYNSSCVLFSKQIDYGCNLKGCNIVCKSNKARDLKRYRSIRMLAGDVAINLNLEC